MEESTEIIDQADFIRKMFIDLGIKPAEDLKIEKTETAQGYVFYKVISSDFWFTLDNMQAIDKYCKANFDSYLDFEFPDRTLYLFFKS